MKSLKRHTKDELIEKYQDLQADLDAANESLRVLESQGAMLEDARGSIRTLLAMVDADRLILIDGAYAMELRDAKAILALGVPEL